MNTNTKKAMPKGGRKGGRIFPRINLKEASEYSRRLVSKTHIGPQPAGTILIGVFDSATAPGKVRASALKQFGLLEGRAAAYQASTLAKALSVATGGDLLATLQQVFLKPPVFKALFETFHGDKVTLAKVRQQASNLDVHPDSLDDCARVFTESAQFAGIAILEGEELRFHPAKDSPPLAEEPPTDDSALGHGHSEAAAAGPPPPSEIQEKKGADAKAGADRPISGRSVIHVNIDLDSSLDTEKLEKQLELLKRYGAI